MKVESYQAPDGSAPFDEFLKQPPMSWRHFRDELRRDPEEAWRVYASDLKVRLAANVLRLREAKGWSQEELARRTGTRQPNISKLEGAETNVTADTIGKLAAALGASVDELLRDSGPSAVDEPGVDRIPRSQVGYPAP